MIDIADQTYNRWRSILPMFGIPAELLTGRHRPCPICEGKDRFRFDDKDGRGSSICNICGYRNGMDLVMAKTGMSFKDACAAIRERLGETATAPSTASISPERAQLMRRELWAKSRVIGDDEAAAYLMRRGFIAPFPTALRFCPSAPVSNHPTRTELPALLALVRASDGSAVNIHRTYLEGGDKAKIEAPRRMMPGDLPGGAAIRLSPHNGVLGVAEGLETAMAVERDAGIPCWSTISSTLLAKFIAPADVVELHVYGDNDPTFGGQAAAFQCAHRNAVRPNSPRVSVHIPGLSFNPSKLGTDWANFQAGQEAA
ncbi:MAG TPA: primase-helicase zinc-binding domain-containing protein [Allosphingosinicella sp.]|jgi:putative DNA primase/helicase